MSLRFVAVGLLICVGLFSPGASACDARNRCASCELEERVVAAAANAKKIDTFLSKKNCDSWKDLVFKTVAISFDGEVSCRTLEGVSFFGERQPTCQVAEELDLSIDEKISDVAQSAKVDEMAADGQLECEPNGTLVFNRGKTRFSELDSLFEPVFFTPSGFSNVGKVVGFEVVLTSMLARNTVGASPYWCHDVESVSLIFQDIVDANGESVLPKNI